MQRRTFLASIGSGSTLLASGCLSSSSSEPVVRVTPTCREVTQERTETIYDELESWDAGDYYTWSLSLEEDEAVLINAVRVEGARPALTIKNPDGDVVVDVEALDCLLATATGAVEVSFIVQEIHVTVDSERVTVTEPQ